MAPFFIVLQLLLVHPGVYPQDTATTTGSSDASAPSPYPDVIGDIDIIIIGFCAVLTILLCSACCLCARNCFCRPISQLLDEEHESPRPRNERSLVIDNRHAVLFERNEESVVFDRNVLRDASPELPPTYEEAIRMNARVEVHDG